MEKILKTYGGNLVLDYQTKEMGCNDSLCGLQEFLKVIISTFIEHCFHVFLIRLQYRPEEKNLIRLGDKQNMYHNWGSHKNQVDKI